MARARLRDLGIAIGRLPPGPLNAITDVPGVRVGMVTLVEDDPFVLRTGVTAIVPQEGEIWRRNLFAATHVLNGNGEMTGRAWIDEFGLLCGPIAFTGTFSVGAVHEGMVAAEMALDTGADFKIPVVAETYDGWLSDSMRFAIRPEHLLAALRGATGGPVAEGSVGGGTGMISHEFKAGTGTSSRMVEAAGEAFLLGVLVQANYGSRRTLRLDGVPVGREIPTSASPASEEPDEAAGEAVPSPFAVRPKDGSILVALATDAPLLPHQLKRLAQRAGLGIGRTGGFGYPSSGDIFIAFATGNDLGRATHRDTATILSGLRMLPDMALAPLFEATVEAVEEAIWNALCAADAMTGQQGRVCRALPLDRLPEILRRYGRG
jgi:D-aminopeptidase